MYLSDRQVAKRYGVARSTAWRWVKSDADFPKPVELSPGCTRWALCALEVWELSKSEATPHD